MRRGAAGKRPRARTPAAGLESSGEDGDEDSGRRVEKRWPGCFPLMVRDERQELFEFAGCAVAVGPRTFLSAAHTLLERRFMRLLRANPEAPLSVVLLLDGVPRKASFWVHPARSSKHPEASADLLVGAIIDGMDAFPPEEIRTVDCEREWFRPVPEVWLGGWGNANLSRPSDGRFSAGRAFVVAPHPGYAVELEGGARVGDGDSGTGVFSAPGGGGALIGIALAMAPAGDPTRSLVAVLSHPRTRAWLQDWVGREGFAITGLPAPAKVEGERPGRARAAC